MKIINKQKGLTLIELLIAMAIGTFVLAGVFKVFESTKASSTLLQAESEMQENARFAFSIITSVVQEAGNFGCQTSNKLSTSSLVNTNNNTFRPMRVIEGWEAKNTEYGDHYITNVGSSVISTDANHWVSSDGAQVDNGTLSKESSDFFKIWYTKKQRGAVTSIVDSVLSFSSIDIDKGDIIVINDCQSVAFAQVCTCEDSNCSNMDSSANISTAACSSPGNVAFNASNLNIPTTEVNILEAALFFVGKRDNNQNNMPSLFVRHLGNDATLSAKEEILEGVESMQVLYGEDTDNNKSPNYYIGADKISNWNNVVSMKISLLLRSSKNNIAKGAQPLFFNNAQVTIGSSSDYHLRRVFTSTISLRNRDIGY